MNKRLKIMKVMSLAVLLSLVVFGCTTSSTEEPTTAAEAPTDEVSEAPPEDTPSPELEGDIVRGGLMYDKWWTVVGADKPTEDHPLWGTQSSNTRSGADTWRCKECHGWDYLGVDGVYGSGSHMTGFSGIMSAASMPANEVLSWLNGEENSDHDFSSLMGEQDLIDLTLFITQGLIDDSLLVNDDKTSAGDAAQGETLYGDVCVNCHGPDGNAINFSSIDDPEFLGHLAPDNPWEFIHKVRFGQPGWPMPSGISNGWTEQDVANVLAYAQGFTSDPAVSGGAQLYDKWWDVVGADAPTEDQPLWSTQSTNERSGADTWRCKECHGWDYLGVDGAYGSGSHMTGFPGVLSASSMSSDELLAWFNGEANPDHDFSGGMDDFALNALVTFIQSEMADITGYVNDDKTVNGNPVNGQEMFEGTCATCHGVDGKKINFGDEDEPEYVGTIAADNPWEFFHKASFGQPDSPMPSGIALGWSMEQIADLLAYAQTLPTE